ncbi:MAG TPA: glycosyltransferase family 4 protein [Terriglobales bacterium]|jgi:glycosyltransferase involved in cell wall biosynthesis|nr:glycosyltransferase family 4 protein [Terriglobales bacterium]
MRILYCNKYNYPFSGTEAYLFELIRRMDTRHHETALFSMDHGHASAFAGRSYLIPYRNFKDPGASFVKKTRMAAHALYSPSARRRMRSCLKDYAPDLAHVRGIYHHLSPSILWELKKQGVPVLYHLNDFKILCPNYNFVAHGRTCELCLGGNYFHVVTEKCHAGSRSAGVVLAAEAYLHKWLQTYQRCVDLFLAPTGFVRDKLVSAGFPARQIEVLPHFQALPAPENLVPEKGYILYFGRLSAEKGIDELLHAMARLPHIPLVIAGEGPERERLEALARDLKLRHVLFAGMVGGAKLEQLVAGCSFSVFPSHAYETLGKSILESYAWGRPVVASDLGSRREMVEPGVTGLLYPAGDLEQLTEAIEFLFNRSKLAAKMGVEGRRRLQNGHNPDRHLDALLEIYSRMASRKRRTTAPSAVTPMPEPAPKPLRVAFIGGRGMVSKYSGIESYYEEVGSELARRGHEVTVYCRNYFTPPLKRFLGMRVLRLPAIRSKHLETLTHTFLSTVHAMFSGYDVVHYHCLGPALFSFFPRLTGAKTVVTVQGLDWQRRKWDRIASLVLRIGEAAAIFLPSETMVVSKTLQRYYATHYRRATLYIPNGACLRPRRPAKRISAWGLKPNNYILFLGRLSPEKNCDLLIDAFEDLSSDMHLVLAGGSSHSDEYMNRLRQHESEQVRFLPWVAGEDLDELLTNAAVFVLPSDLEGLSLALLDAMAAGVCVLASDIPENQEVVGGIGFTFRHGDRSDLSRVLDLLIRNPDLRRESATKCEQHARQHYLWSDIASSIEKAYYKILDRRHPAEAVATAVERRSSVA